MPNWIEGNMKVRGTQKDLFKFFSEAFTFYKLERIEESGKIDIFEVEDKTAIKIDSDDESYAEIKIPEGCWLKGSCRSFVSDDSYIYLEDIESGEQITVCIPLKQAWGWNIDDYIKLSRDYNVDIKCIGWEKGMAYKGEVEVVRGQKPIYKETEYDDWNWDAECPNMGG